MNISTIENVMPAHLKKMLTCTNSKLLNGMEEIRIRVGQPIIIETHQDEYGLNRQGACDIRDGYIARKEDIEGIFNFISGFSTYALEDEFRQGYITIAGGHRIGVVGKVVVENQSVKTLKVRDIGAINIRVARQVIGCSDKILPYILKNKRVCHTLIVSPPKCGKTTVLRDIIRNLSTGFYGQGPFNVGVVDERSEIAGCYKGVPQNDLGMRTDVLDACPKAMGINMLLRSMAPEVLAVDEIGKKEDYDALEEALGGGVSIICTIHGADMLDCLKKPALKSMIDKGLFERIVVLTNRPMVGTVKAIIDTTNNFEVIG